MIIYNEPVGRNENGEVMYEEKIQSVFTTREMAETLYEATLDMDYMDYAETRETDIASLTEQIEKIKSADFQALFTTLEYLTDRFYDYDGRETECLIA